ncbi:MAG: anthranilate phosphoribosyltransferase [Sphingobacteriales bacterium]|jgi:anthranilate phosphoribosyltransferase|nr:anthranilate phosphoribosyltransferase [Sphingobacteriales bacterium]
MKKLMQYLFAGNMLSKSEAAIALKDIASGNQNDAQVAAFLAVYNMRMPSTEELIGFRQAMLDLATPLDFGKQKLLDIVGTGGDGKDTFNISTLASIVCAGAGLKVAKHGNYGVSSVSGSSNILEYLGVKFAASQEELNEQLRHANITFLHAPLFHPAMKNVAPVRKQLQVKTIFNLLGPLVNPANPTTQIIGVYNEAVGKLYKNVLSATKVNFAVIHSLDGYDEISLTNDTSVYTKSMHYLMAPQAFGFSKIHPLYIHGGDTMESNAAVFMNVLEGKATQEQTNVVLANAGLAISIFRKTDILHGVAEAKESLDSGMALNTFKQLKSFSNG